MKQTILLITTMFFWCQFAISQNTKNPEDTTAQQHNKTSKDAAAKEDEAKKDQDNEEDYGWSNRFAFMLGGGASIVTNKIYLDPVVNKSNNAVIIEEAEKTKPNLSMGIVYTPFVSTITRYVDVKKNGKTSKDTLYTYAPRGFSIALFLNPVSLSKLSETGLANTVDLGMGLGWRSGNFSIFGTVEFFSLRQPRDYFIDEFKDNNKSYIINGQTQSTISTNDNDVFKNKVITALGVKIAYALDIVKNYSKQSSDK